MQITFNGVVIAREGPEGGFDSVMGFEPQGEQDVQIVQVPRSSWANIFPRGNCTQTLTGEIYPATFATNADAVLALYKKFACLPKSGPLTLTEGSTIVNFATAVLKHFKVVKRNGISVAYELTFVVTKPEETQTPILNQDGSALQGQDGNPILPQ